LWHGTRAERGRASADTSMIQNREARDIPSCRLIERVRVSKTNL
jgi:hypothetical protein